MGHALKIISADGDVLASLSDKTRCVGLPSETGYPGYHMALD